MWGMKGMCAGLCPVTWRDGILSLASHEDPPPCFPIRSYPAWSPSWSGDTRWVQQMGVTAYTYELHTHTPTHAGTHTPTHAGTHSPSCIHSHALTHVDHCFCFVGMHTHLSISHLRTLCSTCKTNANVNIDIYQYTTVCQKVKQYGRFWRGN